MKENVCYLRGKFAIIREQRDEIRYHHRARGWTTIESYGNGTKVDDPISKGQKDHPRCVVTMCRRGVTGPFKKIDLPGLSYAYFEKLYAKNIN